MNGTALKAKAGRPAPRPVVEQCVGCDHALKDNNPQLCSAFAFPDAKWRLGPCSLATHVKAETSKASDKVRVGQQKQKKK